MSKAKLNFVIAGKNKEARIFLSKITTFLGNNISKRTSFEKFIRWLVLKKIYLMSSWGKLFDIKSFLAKSKQLPKISEEPTCKSDESHVAVIRDYPFDQIKNYALSFRKLVGRRVYVFANTLRENPNGKTVCVMLANESLLLLEPVRVEVKHLDRMSPCLQKELL